MRGMIAAAVLLSGAMVVWFRQPILFVFGDFLVIQDALLPADVIHVISGPDDRTDYSIRLYHQGYARQIFFTGGWCSDIQGNHAARGRARAMAQNVPPDAIAGDGADVMSTYAEVERLREFIRQSPEPIRSVIAVSDPFHMRRAQWIYRQVLGPDVHVQMAPVPFTMSPYRSEWWTDDGSRQYVRNEYIKLAYNIARYQLARGPVQKWLASLDRE